MCLPVGTIGSSFVVERRKTLAKDFFLLIFRVTDMDFLSAGQAAAKSTSKKWKVKD
jgi:hypothetical protein